MRRLVYKVHAAALLFVLLLSQASAAIPESVVPVGKTIGLQLEMQCVVVADFDTKGNAQQAGLKKGDQIIEVDGAKTENIEDISKQLQNCGGKDITVTVQRNGKEMEFLITPVKTEQTYKLGILARDEISGIGTVTFYDPETGAFGALGHGVTDPETAKLLPVSRGQALASSIAEVQKGLKGTPGQLRGAVQRDAVIGTIEKNTNLGIFGTLDQPLTECNLYQVAPAREIKTGKATILSNVSGESVQEYDVEIEKLYVNSDESGRNILLKVCDEDLLERTGGIVQGMSGSPIIQNGKIIGAVTHVLVNDPTRGYGIFLENMLKPVA